MYEQIVICILKILNFVSVCFLLFSQKNAQILKGALSWGRILLTNPRENRENFTGYVYRRLKRDHPGHK